MPLPNFGEPTPLRPTVPIRRVHTVCKVGACEPFCGLIASVDGAGRMVHVEPDPDHPISRGYACIKGLQIPAIQNDPDRLLYPVKRGAAGLARIGWDDAVAEIGGKLRELRQRHGPRSIATYWGNAADSVAISLTNTFCHAFGSPNSFNVLSLEYTDRGMVAARVLGDENLILQPDASQTQYALLLGTNPVVTNGMALLQRRPRIAADLMAIRHRGGKVVVVDPRRTETARIADKHLAIRPGTDLFFLLALLKRIRASGGFDKALLDRCATGLADWEQLLDEVELEGLSKACDLPLADILEVADGFAAAPSAFATTRVGVQTSHNTVLTEWAVMTLNAVTGNIDRPGGMFFNPGAIDVPALIRNFTRRAVKDPSRIGGWPQIFGGPPSSTFADDVLSDDPDRIRALVVVAGNPVISFPNTRRVEQALRRLDLLVCVDIYPSDTSAFAHYALPARTAFEKGGLHFLTSNFEPRPFVEWRRQVVAPRGQARSEWSIFKALSRSAGVPFLNDPLLDGLDRLLARIGLGVTEDMLYRYVLGWRASLGRLRRLPHGLATGALEWGRFLRGGLRTPDGRLQLAPKDFVAALREAMPAPPAPSERFPLLLISGARRSASYNSWTYNIPALADKLQGNFATLSALDARRLGIEDGQVVEISTSTGTIDIKARVTDEIRPGVVAVHQFWGHVYGNAMTNAASMPGINVNHLNDDRALDRLCGMPVFNGVPCAVRPK